MTILEKLQNKFSDLHDDADFLKHKEVSWRFKVLNFLSGDILRNYLAVTCAEMDDLICQHKDIAEYREKYGIAPEEAIEYYKGLDYKMERIKKDLGDIWKI